MRRHAIGIRVATNLRLIFPISLKLLTNLLRFHFIQSQVRVEGIEPSQALSYWSLNPARLTTPAYPHSGNQRFPHQPLPSKENLN